MRILLVVCLVSAAPLAPAWAQPPHSSGGSISIPWSQITGTPAPSPATPSRAQRDRQKQLEEWQRAKRESQRPPRPLPALSRPVDPPTSVSEGFSVAAGVLMAGIGLFWALFAWVHRSSGMGSGYYAPHKPDPGPIDREQVRKFVNSPSPPPLDLGIRDASFPEPDSSDYGLSSWSE